MLHCLGIVVFTILLIRRIEQKRFVVLSLKEIVLNGCLIYIIGRIWCEALDNSNIPESVFMFYGTMTAIFSTIFIFVVYRVIKQLFHC